MEINKKILLFLLVGICLMRLGSAFSGSGTGSLVDPYVITNCTQLQEISNAITANYSLGNDINCKDTSTWNSGAGFVPIGSSSPKFTGSLSGQNYSISHLFISRSGTNYVGLFGYTDSSTNISSVSLINASIIGSSYTGGLVGYNSLGLVSNSDITGSVTGTQYTGGLVGYNTGTIGDSYAIINVSGSTYVGGFSGYNSLVIENSYSAGNVVGTGDTVGGFVAYNSENITDSYSTATTSTSLSSGDYVGGFTGRHTGGTILRCYSTGNVNGTESVGGFSGGTSYQGNIYRSYATGNVYCTGRGCGGFIGLTYPDPAILRINDSYARGNVTGDGNVAYMGGFVGEMQDVYVTNSYATGFLSGASANSAGGFTNYGEYACTNCFWDNETSGTSTSSSAATGKTTAQMKNVSTFTDTATAGLTSAFDFQENPNNDSANNDYWGINPNFNDGYPTLVGVGSGVGLLNPIVSLNAPADNYYFPRVTNITFNCSVTGANVLTNISLYITNNQNTSFSLNQTTNISGTSNSSNWTLELTLGNYTWNCLAYDNTNREDWGTNRSIASDTVYPIINITYPLNTGYNLSTYNLNYTYSDTSEGYCWYSKDDGVTNSTPVSSGTNWTELNSSAGSNTWVVYCNDSAGNTNSSSVTFTNTIPVINVTWLSPEESVNVSQNQFFEVQARVSCSNANCGEINVTLDPAEETVIMNDTFEGETECSNTCGVTCTLNSNNWTNVAGVNWIVDAGGTSSSSTGPSLDHTLGTSVGKYLYTEASNPCYKNYSIVSKAINADEYSVLNLTFWYHMYGAAMGTLYVDINESGSWIEDVWSLSGQQQTSGTDSWDMATVDLSEYFGTINIRIRGLTSSSTYTSDMAIDDIVLIGSGSAKSGVISMDPTATPFYTNITNPYNLTLNAGESQDITWYVNATGNVNETHEFFIYANQTVDASISAITSKLNITILTNGSYVTGADQTAPVINFDLANNSYSSDTGLDINYVIVEKNISACWYSNDTYSTNTTITCGENITSLTWPVGQHTLTIWANDSVGNNGSSSLTFTIDVVNPNATLLTPTNNSYNTTTNSQNFTVNITDETGIKNATLYIYNESGSLINRTTETFADKVLEYTLGIVVTLADGVYDWFYTIFDWAGNTFTTSNKTITVDATYPLISINYPTNNTYTTDTELNINYTIYDYNLSACWYSNDTYSTNTTITCGENITVLIWPEGIHNITIWTNDSGNYVNSSSIVFTIDTINPNINITYPANNLISNNSGLNINYTLSDINLDSCWYSNDTMSSNTTLASCTNLTDVTWTNGNHNITIWINDSAGNMNSSSVSFIIDTTILINFTNPTPTNNTYTTDTSLKINFSIDEIRLDEVKYNWNGTNFTMYNNSLILMYNFDDYTRLNDTSNYGNNGATVNQASHTASGKYGGAFDFDGVDDRVTIPTTFGIGTTNFSISTWINLDSVSEGGAFVKIGGTSPNQGFAIGVGESTFDNTGNNLILLYEGERWIDTNDNIGIGWHHVIMTVDGSGYPEAFIDGISTYSDSAGKGVEPQSSITYIGGYTGSVGENRHADVTLDEVRIWNRTLSAEEVYQQYVSNLKKIDSDSWELYVNQSLNASTNLTDGQYTYFASAKDDVGNENLTEIRTFIVDTINPNATLLTPTNGTYNNTASQNFTVNITDGIGIKNATLYIYNETGLINQTSTSFLEGVLKYTLGVVVTLTDGVYNWFYQIFDWTGNTFTTSNKTITIDLTSPSINIVSPENNTYTPNTEINVNYTVSDTNLDSCWYSNDTMSVNTSLTCGENITSIIWTEGIHNITVWTNDSAGNENNSRVLFTVDTANPIVNIIYPTNITYDILINSINYTYSDSNPGYCWWSNSSGVWNSSAQTPGINWTGITSLEGNNTWTVYCNDSAGKENSSSITFTNTLPKIGLEVILPTGNVNVSQNEFFEVKVNVSCTNADCGEINITLDPETEVGTNWTFNVSESWTVPSGVSEIYVVAVGGGGGGSASTSSSNGYSGGGGGGGGLHWRTNISVTAGETLNLTVGMNGSGGSGSGNNDASAGGESALMRGENYLVRAGGGGAGSYNGGTIATGGTTYNSSLGGGGGTGGAGGQGSSGNTAGGGGGAGGYSGNGGKGSDSTSYNEAAGSGGAGGGGTGANSWTTAITFGGGGVGIPRNGSSGGAICSTYNCQGAPGSGGSNQRYGGGGSGAEDDSAASGGNGGAGVVYIEVTALGNVKSGIISMVNGTTPFYTTTTNPYNLTLNNGQSEIITWYINATGELNSTHNFFIYANRTSDLSVSNITAKWNITIINEDITAPSITFVSPANNSYSSDIELDIDLTITDGNLDSCWYSQNAGITNTSLESEGTCADITSETWTEGQHIVYVWANDTGGYNASSSITFTIDTTSPYFTTIPVNTSLDYGELLSVDFDATDTIDFDSYSINDATNFTISSEGILTNATALINDTVYEIIVTINDSTSNLNTTNYKVSIGAIPDNTNPLITIIYPTTQTYTDSSREFEISSNENLSSCIVSLNDWINNNTMSLNSSLTGASYTDSHVADGSYTAKFWCNDTSGNINNTENISFTIDTINPVVNIDFPTDNLYINYNESINLNYSIPTNDTNSCWYSIDLGLTNITIENCINTTLNLSEGNHLINLWINDSANLKGSDSVNFTIDLTHPVVNLISPANNTLNTTTNTIDFYYNVSDANSVTNCSLIINDLINSTIINPEKNQINNITIYLLNGNYNWSVNCTDIANNINSSKTRNLNVSYVITIDYGNFDGDTTSFPNSTSSGGGSNGSSSTDTSNIISIVNLTLEKVSYGKISFLNIVDLSNDIENLIINFSKYIDISNNSIEINSTGLTGLNIPARLKLYNLTFDNPQVLRDGAVCSDCVEESYDINKTLTFTVTGFSTYSARETPTTPATDTEDNGGSGGGGGTIYECTKDSNCKTGYSCYNHKCVKLFDVKILALQPLIDELSFELEYLIKGMANISGDVIIKFWIEDKDKNQLMLGQDAIYFGSFEEKIEKTIINLPYDILDESYDLYVQVNFENYQIESFRKINLKIDKKTKQIAEIELAEQTPMTSTYLYSFLGILLIIILVGLFWIKIKKIKRKIYKKSKKVKDSLNKTQKEIHKSSVKSSRFIKRKSEKIKWWLADFIRLIKRKFRLKKKQSFVIVEKVQKSVNNAQGNIQGKSEEEVKTLIKKSKKKFNKLFDKLHKSKHKFKRFIDKIKMTKFVEKPRFIKGYPCLSKLSGKKVYSSKGNKIGKVQEAVLLENKIYGWIIKPNKKYGLKKKVLIKHKNIIAIKDIFIVDWEIEDFLNKYKKNYRSFLLNAPTERQHF